MLIIEYPRHESPLCLPPRHQELFFKICFLLSEILSFLFLSPFFYLVTLDRTIFLKQILCGESGILFSQSHMMVSFSNDICSSDSLSRSLEWNNNTVQHKKVGGHCENISPNFAASYHVRLQHFDYFFCFCRFFPLFLFFLVHCFALIKNTQTPTPTPTHNKLFLSLSLSLFLSFVEI